MLTCKQKGVDYSREEVERGRKGTLKRARPVQSCAVGLCKHYGLFAMRKSWRITRNLKIY